MPHDPEDYHWPNLLMVLEQLLESSHPRARSYSERVARQATEQWCEPLGYAHSTRVFQQVRDHWNSIAPALMQRIGTANGGHHAVDELCGAAYTALLQQINRRRFDRLTIDGRG